MTATEHWVRIDQTEPSTGSKLQRAIRPSYRPVCSCGRLHSDWLRTYQLAVDAGLAHTAAAERTES